MKDEMDQEVQEKLTEALAGLREAERNAAEKREEKFWKDMEIPFTLHDGLNKYTKNELDDIRKHLEIKNASSLKKAELIALLAETIPAIMKQTCLQWDKDRFHLLGKIARNGGVLPAPDLQVSQIEFLRSSGIVHTGCSKGKKILALPEELIEPVLLLENSTEVEAVVSKNTEWIKLTLGLLYYYGTLHFPQLKQMLQTYTGGPLPVSEYLTVMNSVNSYNEVCRINGEGFSNMRVFDAKRITQEHRMRNDLDFYPFTKEQLLNAGEPDFVERNKSYVQFVNFLIKHYAINKQEADSLAEDCVYATRIGHGPKEVMQFLSNRLEFESTEMMQNVMDRAVHLMNNTREWFLKGYMSSELFAKEKLQPLPANKSDTKADKKQIKTGRNEPCPCGSGEKYKKCCGR